MHGASSLKITLIQSHLKVKRIFRPVVKSSPGEPLLIQTKTASGLLLCVVVSFLSMQCHFTCYIIEWIMQVQTSRF